MKDLLFHVLPSIHVRQYNCVCKHQAQYVRNAVENIQSLTKIINGMLKTVLTSVYSVAKIYTEVSVLTR